MRKEKLVSQPIVITNKGGGGGTIAAAYAAQKRGDPYTVVSFPTGMMLTGAQRSGLDIGLEKFQPLALLGFDINCLMVNADSPWKSVRELVEAAKGQAQDDQRLDRLDRIREPHVRLHARASHRRTLQYGRHEKRCRGGDGGARRTRAVEHGAVERRDAARRDGQDAHPRHRITTASSRNSPPSRR